MKTVHQIVLKVHSVVNTQAIVKSIFTHVSLRMSNFATFLYKNYSFFYVVGNCTLADDETVTKYISSRVYNI